MSAYRMRQILPPGWVIAVFVANWLGFEALARELPPGEGDYQRLLVVGIGAAFYGAYRAMAFHPLSKREYGQWLASTPWTSRMPLPLGPIHLVWQDALVLVALVAAAMHIAERFWPVPLLTFLAAYLLLLAICFMQTGARGYGWVVLFSLGLGLLTRDPGWALAVGIAAYFVAFAGIRRSLEQFPWPAEPWFRQQIGTQPGLVPSNPDMMKDRLGWPYSRLRPFAIEPAITMRTALALSLLVAWYLYVIAATFGSDARESVSGAYAISLCGFPALRVLLYLSGIRPPISALGRLFTGRLIIPGFDRVFVAPLAALVSGVLIPVLLDRLGVAIDISLPITVGAIAWISLSWGPTLAEWRLTGSHRLVAGIGTGSIYAKI